MGGRGQRERDREEWTGPQNNNNWVELEGLKKSSIRLITVLFNIELCNKTSLIVSRPDDSLDYLYRGIVGRKKDSKYS